MKVKRIEHVAIAVKNMTQSRKLFEEKLGFKLEYEEYLPQYSTRWPCTRLDRPISSCWNPIATTPKRLVGLPSAARVCFTYASRLKELKQPSMS
jgi:catechol 2,3-dioxygenase-like lactoylglutathione lyase family enzyme